MKKELLLKDLCARLPYRTMVKCNTDGRHEFDEELSDIHIMNFYQFEIKPYLRPMSSMTSDEKIEIEILIFEEWYDKGGAKVDIEGDIEILANCDIGIIYSGFCSDLIDWLNSHHFDYRDLIPKGLALEAPEGMY